MTQAQTTTKAAAFFEAAQDLFSTLYCRWQDEQEYEDINDYAQPLQAIAAKHGVTITKMNKRPFGCNFTTDKGSYVIKVTARAYEYQQVR